MQIRTLAEIWAEFEALVGDEANLTGDKEKNKQLCELIRSGFYAGAGAVLETQDELLNASTPFADVKRVMDSFREEISNDTLAGLQEAGRRLGIDVKISEV